jgi:hypothetical protein
LNRTVKRRSVVFLVSDFQDEGYEQTLRIARRRHDVIPVVVADQREQTLPNVGLVELQDAETGKIVFLDASSRSHREAYQQRAAEAIEQRERLLKKLRMDPIYLFTGEDFVDPLRKFFHKREARR